MPVAARATAARSKPRGAEKTDSDRHRAIRDSAAALFARNGIAQTSVREIADSVGILSGSLYHHFASKDQVVEEIIGIYLDDLLERYRSAALRDMAPRAALENLIRASLEMIRDHPEATQIYQTEGNYIRRLPQSDRVRAVVSQIQQTWIDVLDRGVDTGVFRAGIDPVVAHRLIRDAIWFTARWFRPSAEMSRDDLVRECIAIFVDGLAAS